MPTSPTPIAALPTPPSTANPAGFDSAADAFLGALPTFRTETNTVAANVYDNAVEAAGSASAASGSASTASTHATNAGNSASAAAASALAAANTVATIPEGAIDDSTTSLANVWSSSKVNTALAAAGGTAGVNSRSADYTILTGDKGKIVQLTGSTSRTFTTPAAATVGAGWYCYVQHAGDDTAEAANPVALTIDGNASETIDGVATVTEYKGGTLLITSNGTNWVTMRIAGGFARFTQTASFVWPASVSGAFVDVVGGGGGGYGGGNGGSGNSAGGGGGARVLSFVHSQALNTAISCVVGAGGAGGAGNNTSGNIGLAGGFSHFQIGTSNQFRAGGGGAGGNGQGGAGGAQFSSGLATTSNNRAGSIAWSASNFDAIGHSGGGGANGTGSAGNAEWGGGGGGRVSTFPLGGSSRFGGGGGGSGSWGGASVGSPGAGGLSGMYQDGNGGLSGISGASPTAGGAGASRNFACGDGGGGGGGANTVGTTGAAGGAGGFPGGGGGGGGNSNTGSGGNAGNGGRGEVRVWYW